MDASRLMSVAEVARLFGVSETQAYHICEQNLIAPVTAYSADAVLAAHQRKTAGGGAGPVVVPVGAPLPATIVHEPTKWEVHPDLGLVFSTRTNGGPRRLGFVKNGQLCATRTERTTGENREWRIGRVVWEAVNKRPVPEGWVVIHANGDHLDNRYANLKLEPHRPILDKSHPSSGKSRRTAPENR